MLNRRSLASFGLALAVMILAAAPLRAADENRTAPPAIETRVRSTADFEVTGDGKNPAWDKTDWLPLPRRTDGVEYKTRFKLLYSTTGLYVLFDAGDKRLTTTGKKDTENLWEEDVFEVFLWTDENHPVYFEYEISPLANELTILVPNLGGRAYGWLPWHYDGPRRTRKATAVSGGSKEPGAEVRGWTAEVFVPYALLAPLQNVPPKPGTHWRANFYRIDYDEDKQTRWTWAPVGPSFHEYKKFGGLVFE